MWSVNACVVGTNGLMNRKRAMIKRLIMALKVMGGLEGLLICGESIWIFFFLQVSEIRERCKQKCFMDRIWQIGRKFLLSFFPGLPCFLYPLLILPLPFIAHHLHSLIWLYHSLKISFVGRLEALSCIFLILGPRLTEKPPSETLVAVVE